MSHEYEATIANAFLDFIEKATSTAAATGLLVHLRFNRARRSRS